MTFDELRALGMEASAAVWPDWSEGYAIEYCATTEHLANRYEIAALNALLDEEKPATIHEDNWPVFRRAVRDIYKHSRSAP